MLKPMTASPHYTRAITFLEQHQGEHLAADEHRLYARCIYHLLEHCKDLDSREARLVTLRAAGELSARGCRDYIDLDLTTSFSLVVSDHRGNKTCYTLGELLRALEHAHAAGTV